MHYQGTTMEQCAGIDVSLDSASVCIVDAQAEIVKEAMFACESEALMAWFAAHGTPMAWIGPEAAPLLQRPLPRRELPASSVRGAFTGTDHLEDAILL
jgi:hypothetical protein